LAHFCAVVHYAVSLAMCTAETLLLHTFGDLHCSARKSVYTTCGAHLNSTRYWNMLCTMS